MSYSKDIYLMEDGKIHYSKHVPEFGKISN